MRYFKVIGLYFSNALQAMIASPWGFFIFLFSKLVRYGLFILFLYFLTDNIKTVGNFTSTQILIFYLTFNLIDTTAQMLFREVYRFRPLVVSGGFDMILSKPFSPLLRVLVGGPDFIDMAVLIVLSLVTGHLVIFSIHPNLIQVLTFLLLLLNSIFLAAAFHITVLSIGVLTLSVDHLVMIYRDITALMRIPVDFFTNPLRAILTFVIPVGIMFTFPTKALLGMLSWQLTLVSFAVAILFLFLSVRFWRSSLRYYQSASS